MSARSSALGQLVEARGPAAEALGQLERRARRGGWRRRSSSTPWSARAWAVSSLVSPAPMMTTSRPGQVAHASRARSTATEDTDGLRGPDRGLRAHALAGLQRGAEQLVRHRPGRPGLERLLEGAPDLALDLGLADDHRLEARGHAEEVARGVAVARRVDRGRRAPSGGCRPAGPASRARSVSAATGIARRRGRPRCGCRSRSPRPRRHLGLGPQLAEEVLGARRREGQALAQLDRRGLVRDAEGEQLAHGSGSRSSAGGRLAVSSTSSRSMRTSFDAMIAT